MTAPIDPRALEDEWAAMFKPSEKPPDAVADLLRRVAEIERLLGIAGEWNGG